MAKKLFPIRLEEKIIEKLKQIAKEEGRTVADVIREGLIDLIKKRETKPKPKHKQGGK